MRRNPLWLTAYHLFKIKQLTQHIVIAGQFTLLLNRESLAGYAHGSCHVSGKDLDNGSTFDYVFVLAPA